MQLKVTTPHRLSLSLIKNAWWLTAFLGTMAHSQEPFISESGSIAQESATTSMYPNRWQVVEVVSTPARCMQAHGQG